MLGLFLSFSFSIQQGVNQLEDNTIGRLAPVVMLEQTGRDAERITFEMAHNVTGLSYVNDYSIIATTVFTTKLTDLYIPPSFDELVTVQGRFSYDNLLEEIMSLVNSIYINGWNGHRRQDAISFSGERPVEFDLDIIELTSGRFPTAEEIDAGTLVALVPRLFAERNGLSLGDNLILEYEIPNQLCSIGNQGMTCEDINDGAAFHRYTHFEIIGLFDLNYDNLPVITDFSIAEQIFKLYNDIFITHAAAYQLADEVLPYHVLRWQSLLERWGWDEDDVEKPNFEYPVDGMQVIFTLYDLRDWNLFEEAVLELLPAYWGLRSTRNTFLPIINSLATMSSIADHTLIAAVVVAVVILSLITILMLRDRRYEIGIYLALGEKKSRVLIQLLTELFIVSIVALSSAMLIGNITSNQLSSNLLQTEIVHQFEEVERLTNLNVFSDPTRVMYGLERFSSDPLSTDEIMVLYDVSMPVQAMVSIIALSVLIVFLSAIIPIFITLKKSPKKVLTFNQI